MTTMRVFLCVGLSLCSLPTLSLADDWDVAVADSPAILAKVDAKPRGIVREQAPAWEMGLPSVYERCWRDCDESGRPSLIGVGLTADQTRIAKNLAREKSLKYVTMTDLDTTAKIGDGLWLLSKSDGGNILSPYPTAPRTVPPAPRLRCQNGVCVPQ